MRLVTAIDISDTMIAEAKKNVPEANYVRVSMTDIYFENKCFLVKPGGDINLKSILFFNRNIYK